MARARKKPVEIEYVIWDGNKFSELPEWLTEATRRPTSDTNSIVRIGGGTLEIRTLEGRIYGSVGDHIIRGVNGELYPCKPDIFEKTYDRI